MDCVNGVVGDVRLAAVLALPFALDGNEVVSCGDWFDVPAGVGGFCIAFMAIYVSTHFAVCNSQSHASDAFEDSRSSKAVE